MTLEGAINLNETDNYVIYAMNSATTGQYGIVMPKNINGTLNMLVDLHMKGSFDGVSSGSKTKEQLVSEIGEEYNKLKTKYSDGMLVIPMIDENMFKSAVMNNDKQKMFDQVKKIGAITSELYKKLTDSGVEKQKIDQKIIVVEKNQDDEKFVLWLKEQMPNFVDGIRYSELTSLQENVNPFMSSNNSSIFGPVVDAPKVETVSDSVPVSAPSIFDTPAPVAPVAPVQAEPVVSAPIFEQASVSVNEQQQNQNSSNVGTAGSDVDIFGIPLNVQGVSNDAVVNNGTAQSNVAPSAPVVPELKPVESAPLEGTTTFNPIPNSVSSSSNVSVNQDDNNGNGSSVENASKGFANLIILLVILVGVTVVSIELGKFLYNVYGA